MSHHETCASCIDPAQAAWRKNRFRPIVGMLLIVLVNVVAHEVSIAAPVPDQSDKLGFPAINGPNGSPPGSLDGASRAYVSPAKMTINGNDGGFIKDGQRIEWYTFSIAKNNTVTFNQKSSNDLVVNNVFGGKISDIQGNIVANGHVLIANPYGITFGTNSVVDVGGLTAAAFAVGRAIVTPETTDGAGQIVPRKDTYVFTTPGTTAPPPGFGVVNNQGSIKDGKFVTLLGQQVNHSGSIALTSEGKALLGAGGSATMTIIKGEFNFEVNPGAAVDKVLVNNAGDISAAVATKGHETDANSITLLARLNEALLSTVLNGSGVKPAKAIFKTQGGGIFLGRPEKETQVSVKIDDARNANKVGTAISTTKFLISAEDTDEVGPNKAPVSKVEWKGDGTTISFLNGSQIDSRDVSLKANAISGLVDGSFYSGTILNKSGSALVGTIAKLHLEQTSKTVAHDFAVDGTKSLGYGATTAGRKTTNVGTLELFLAKGTITVTDGKVLADQVTLEGDAILGGVSALSALTVTAKTGSIGSSDAPFIVSTTTGANSLTLTSNASKGDVYIKRDVADTVVGSVNVKGAAVGVYSLVNVTETPDGSATVRKAGDIVAQGVTGKTVRLEGAKITLQDDQNNAATGGMMLLGDSISGSATAGTLTMTATVGSIGSSTAPFHVSTASGANPLILTANATADATATAPAGSVYIKRDLADAEKVRGLVTVSGSAKDAFSLVNADESASNGTTALSKAGDITAQRVKGNTVVLEGATIKLLKDKDKNNNEATGGMTLLGDSISGSATAGTLTMTATVGSIGSSTAPFHVSTASGANPLILTANATADATATAPAGSVYIKRDLADAEKVRGLVTVSGSAKDAFSLVNADESASNGTTALSKAGDITAQRVKGNTVVLEGATIKLLKDKDKNNNEATGEMTLLGDSISGSATASTLTMTATVGSIGDLTKIFPAGGKADGNFKLPKLNKGHLTIDGAFDVSNTHIVNFTAAKDVNLYHGDSSRLLSKGSSEKGAIVIHTAGDLISTGFGLDARSISIDASSLSGNLILKRGADAKTAQLAFVGQSGLPGTGKSFGNADAPLRVDVSNFKNDSVVQVATQGTGVVFVKTSNTPVGQTGSPAKIRVTPSSGDWASAADPLIWDFLQGVEAFVTVIATVDAVNAVSSAATTSANQKEGTKKENIRDALDRGTVTKAGPGVPAVDDNQGLQLGAACEGSSDGGCQ